MFQAFGYNTEAFTTEQLSLKTFPNSLPLGVLEELGKHFHTSPRAYLEHKRIYEDKIANGDYTNFLGYLKGAYFIEPIIL